MFVEEALSNNGKVVFRRVYQLKDIKKVADIPNGVLSKVGGLTEGSIATTISISDLYSLVKKYDKDFSFAHVPAELLVKNGRPIKFYHGTNAKFSSFDLSKVEQIMAIPPLG